MHHGPVVVVVENWIPKIVSSIQPQVSQTGKCQLTSNRPIALFPLFVKVSRFDGKMVKALENAKQNFTTHPITRRTFSQLETLAHRSDEFFNEYLPKAAGKEDMIVCHVFALLADVERFQHSPPGM
ncbi:hypothetical protein T07_8255 [Trichinella nelsoni]|uniref:Uncharacterized protein n=1 Tax=Trichinella nelsoni TaxID=6336 RepID=A0A0V0SKW0_9BILA|nr:hypothetical protein T07_8255 [Trichinella nelsoni]